MGSCKSKINQDIDVIIDNNVIIDNDVLIIKDSTSDIINNYIHDIRNMKVLNKEILNNIENMSNDDKMRIIIIYNDVIKYVNSVL